MMSSRQVPGLEKAEHGRRPAALARVHTDIEALYCEAEQPVVGWSLRWWNRWTAGVGRIGDDDDARRPTRAG